MHTFDGQMQQVSPAKVLPWQQRHAQTLRLAVQGPLFQRLVRGGACWLLQQGGRACGYARSCGAEGPEASLAGLFACEGSSHDWLRLSRAAGFSLLLRRSDDPGLAALGAQQDPFAAYYFAPPPPAPIHPTEVPIPSLHPVRTAADAAWLARLVAATDPRLGGLPGLTAAAVLAGEPGRERWLLRGPQGPLAAACRLPGEEGYDDTEVIVPPVLRGQGLGGRALAGLIACCRAKGRGVLSGIAHDNLASRGMARKAGLLPFSQLTWQNLAVV